MYGNLNVACMVYIMRMHRCYDIMIITSSNLPLAKVQMEHVQPQNSCLLCANVQGQVQAVLPQLELKLAIVLVASTFSMHIWPWRQLLCMHAC